MSSPNFLDRLPDEVLQDILSYALPTDQPFWLEQCTRLPRHRMHDTKALSWLPAGYSVDPGSIEYSPEMVDKHLTAVVEPSQVIHQSQWLMVNSTCRRIRRLGKTIFFATRPLVASSHTLEKLRLGESWLDRSASEQALAWKQHRNWAYASLTSLKHGETTNPDNPEPASRRTWCALSTEDQSLALAQVRHLVLSDYDPSTTSRILKLPRFITGFPKVTKCTLLTGYIVRQQVQAFNVHRPDAGGDTIEGTVAKLFRLLVVIGFDKNVELSIGLSLDEDWEYRRFLVGKAFPILETRARLLGKLP